MDIFHTQVAVLAAAVRKMFAVLPLVHSKWIELQNKMCVYYQIYATCTCSNAQTCLNKYDL